jgi:hypothetical protein
MSKVYVKPKFAQAIDKAINQNKSISDKPGKLDSSLKVLKKIGKAHNHSLPLGFQWLWLKHNVDLLTPYQVKYFNRKKGTSAWKRKGSGEMTDIKENTMEKETKVGNYQTKYFHMCPGAKGLFDGIEDKDVNMDIAERSAMLQDALFFIEKHILEDDETGSPEGYMLVANNLATNIMAMAKMMGLEKEHHYIQGHIDTIKKALSGEDTKSTADKLGESIDEARGSCWVGYQQIGMKDKGGKKVPNCVKETTELFYEENGKGYGYTFEYLRLPEDINEAEYQGRKVKLGKIMQGDTKKFKVYVKNPKGNVVKVNFGQGGDAKGGTMRIRKSNPQARKSFRARHNCDNPGPRHKARYWSCRKW